MRARANDHVPNTIYRRAVGLAGDSAESHAVLLVWNTSERASVNGSASIILEMLIPIYYLIKFRKWSVRFIKRAAGSKPRSFLGHSVLSVLGFSSILARFSQ